MTYEGVPVGEYVADITVQGTVILELKATDALSKAHEMQLVHYLTATGLDVGLCSLWRRATAVQTQAPPTPDRTRGVVTAAPPS